VGLKRLALWGAALASVAIGLSACADTGSPTSSASSSPAPTPTTSSPAARPASLSPTPATAPTTDDIPTALRALIKQRNPEYKIARFKDIKTAQDSQGRLWVSAWTVAAESGWESPEVIAVKADGKWRLVDYGTGIDNPDVPAEVRDEL
jgi:hypothetical protein